MGRGRGRARERHGQRRNREQAKRARENGTAPAPRYDTYEVALENAAFEKYYQAQQIVSESEWPAFMASARTPLPVSFRITGSRSHASDLREYMKKEYFPKLKGFVIDGEEVKAPEPIPWYPDDLAWMYDCGRSALRRSPEIAVFHRFLVSETEVGNINRQEVVSMIPVLFLDVQPGQFVLDTCAAPGSKTVQLLEAMHRNTGDAETPDTEPIIPEGIVIANDANYSRSQMLVHQAKRLQSSCLLVTNHEAQAFPRIFLSDRESDGGRTLLQFDRILCDVPCSGDGTLRKNKAVWGTWSPENGNGLHRLQKAILMRGCELLRVGGRLVYSTCSFNPVENEAVLAAVINEIGGAMRIVDVSSHLPNLVRRPGLTSWKVMKKNGAVFDRYDMGDPEQKGLHATHFPPENAGELGLEHSIRVYPFLQNCGGFFVAVLEKVAAFGSLDRFSAPDAETGLQGETDPKVEADAEVVAEVVAEVDDNDKVDADADAEVVAEVEVDAEVVTDDKVDAEVEVDADTEVVAEVDADAQTDTTHVAEKAPETTNDQEESDRPTKRARVDGQDTKKQRRGWFGGGECPFICVEETNETLKKVCDFYGLSSRFPRGQFVVRTENQVQDFQSIYYVSPPIKQILLASNANKLKIVNTGVKVFKRNGGEQNVSCPYRVSCEGVQTIAPFLSPSRQISISVADLCVFIKNEYPKFSEFSESTRARLGELDMGSCLLRCDPTSEAGYTGSVTTPIVLPFFRANVSGSLLLVKQERRSLLHRLVGEEVVDFTPMEKDQNKLVNKESESAAKENESVKNEDQQES